MRASYKQKGFSVIEIVCVIALIVVLIGVGFAAYAAVFGRAKDVEDLSDRHQRFLRKTINQVDAQ